MHKLAVFLEQVQDMEGKPSTVPPTKRELQGPRPAPLSVRRDSHKIKKPLLAPGPPQQPPRRPVIIYTVSPKVIHAEASDFMAFVQRLTGNSSLSSASSEPYSPAARLAVIEKSHFDGVARHKSVSAAVEENTDGTIHGFENFNVYNLNSGGNIVPTGILSPAPSALPATCPNFFSPMSDPNLMTFLHGLSPAIQGNYTSRSYSDQMNTMPDDFSATMQNLCNTHNLVSPRPPFDPFNVFQSL